MPTHDPLDDRPDEKARREQSPDEAVDEMEEIVDDEQPPATKKPPMDETYGGVPGKSPGR